MTDKTERRERERLKSLPATHLQEERNEFCSRRTSKTPRSGTPEQLFFGVNWGLGPELVTFKGMLQHFPALISIPAGARLHFAHKSRAGSSQQADAEATHL